MTVPPAPGDDEAGGSGQRSSARAWLTAHARLTPRLLAKAPAQARAAFDHDWAPMDALFDHVRLLPAGLWPYLLGCAGGYLLISPGESAYQPGPAELRGRAVHNVAYISVGDLAAGNERPLHVLGHLLDHYLGCAGDLTGPWLTAGGGCRPRWQQAAGRLPGLYALGYGVDDVARASIDDYLAQSLAIYCRDRRRLNVADPPIEKWLRTTLFDAAFWASP